MTSNTMKAAVWTDIGVIELRDVSIPKPKPGQALVKIHAAGVCVTDLHVYTGKLEYGKPPHIMGHEMAGEVIECPEHTHVKIGDRVAIETYVDCGVCEYCLRGERHLCVKAEEIGTFPHQGGYAQYIAVDVKNLVHIPDSVSYDEAAILESAACPAGALYRTKIPMGRTVLVYGTGAAGLAFIQVAKAMGAGEVIVVGRSDSKLAKAKYFGADTVINSSGLTGEALYKRITDQTKGKAQTVIEATGVPEMIMAAVFTCARDGNVILYGLPEKDMRLSFPVEQIILNQVHIHGVTGYPHVWSPLVKMVENKSVNLKDMVTHTMPLERIHEAFAMIDRRESSLIKTVLHPWE